MKLPNFRLHTRIAVVTLALVAAAALGLMFAEEARLREAYLSERHADLDRGVHIQKLRLTQSINTLRQDVLFLSNVPPVSGIVRAAQNRSYDARYRNTTRVWEERLQGIFSAFATAHPDYYQIRYIGVADAGRELVRIRNLNGKLEAVPSAKLQARGEWEWFKATVGLPPGEVHLSGFERHHGELSRPVLHASTPVFTEQGEIFGLVVIDMDATELLESARQGVPQEAQTYIANMNGQYLLHPDPKRAFAFDADGRNAFAADFPEIKAIFDPQTAGHLDYLSPQTNTTKNADAGSMLLVDAERIHYDPAYPARFLLLAYVVPDSAVARQLTAIPASRIIGGFAAMLLVGLLAMLVLRRMFAPLEQITAAAEKITAGERDVRLPQNGSGEIGILNNALGIMLDKLARRERDISRFNAVLEVRVNERTKELGVINARLEEEIVTRRQIEELVQHENEFRRELIEALPGVFFMMDADGHLLMWNRNLRRVLHVSDNDLTGALLSNFIGEKDKASALDATHRVFMMVGDMSLEAELTAKDGVRIPYHLTGRCVPRDGEMVLIGTGVDITERNKAMTILQRHKLVLETALDGFWMTDMEGVLEEVNEAYATMSGYTEQELVGMRISQLEAQGQPEDTRAHIEKLMAEGYDRFETRHRRKDGSVMDIEVAATCMPEHRKLFVFCRDITQRKQAEETIKNTLLFQQKLMDAIPSPIFYKDAECIYLGSNKAFERYIELPPEQFIGKTVYDISPVDLAERYDKADKELLNNPGTQSYEAAVVYSDGTRHDVLFNKATYTNYEGKVSGLIGVILDITERKQIEQELRVTAVTFETHDAILITDAEANIIRVNRAFSEITGYLPEEVLGQNPRIMSSGRHDRAFYIEMWQQLLHVGTWSGEVWDRRKNGEIYPKWLTITAIRDERGETGRYVAIFSDITELKEREKEKLQESDDRFRGTLEQAAVGITHTALDGSFQQANQKFCDLIGYTHEELMHMSYYDITFPADLEEQVRHFQQLVEGEISTYSMEKRYVRKDRSLVWANLTVSLLRDANGTPKYTIGVTEDITERKRADIELNQSRKLLRELVAQSETLREDERKRIAREVHDELGQILTALRMNVSLLRIQFGKRDAVLLEKIEGITKLLDQSIQCARDVVTNLRPVALDMGIVPAIRWLSDEFIKHTGISCIVHTPEEEIHLDDVLAVTAFRVAQESLTNVARYAEASKVEIILGQDDYHFSVTINDNGKGFDCMAIQDHKSFGLLGMRERAIALGGVVNVCSAPQQGTQIFFVVPNQQTAPNQPTTNDTRSLAEGDKP